MPLKSVIVIMCLVGLASLLKPDWALFFIWAGGMALLWIITGQWTAPSRTPPQTQEEKPAPEADDIRPAEGSMESEDLDDLARLDGQEPGNEPRQTP